MSKVRTVVIGGGQSGLSTGYFLAQQKGHEFVILDASERIGNAWRDRWDSLRLFTPARYDGIAGMPFPASPHSFPTKDEMGDYLELYASHFKLPVETGTKVTKVWREGNRYVVTTNRDRIEAENVVVAMSSYQKARVPDYARELSSDVVQLHSSEYRRPSQLKPGDVLVVGAGNSGAEIALDAARSGHRAWLSGRDVGHVPFRIEGLASRVALSPLILRFVFHRVLTVDTPIGRKARPKATSQGATLIRVKPRDLQDAGIERLPRVRSVRDGLPLLENERIADVANVVWCTGFTHGMSWLDLPVFDDRGEPRHKSGIAHELPGIYFVGLHFLHSLSSTMIHGVERDARRIATHIGER